MVTYVKTYQIIHVKIYSLLYINNTSGKFKNVWVGNSDCFLEKLVTFLLASLLSLAEMETYRLLWRTVDTKRQIKDIQGQVMGECESKGHGKEEMLSHSRSGIPNQQVSICRPG